MCGIAGVLSLQKNLSPALIKKTTDTLRHRGPDDEGYIAFSITEKQVYSLWGSDSKIQEGRPISQFNDPAQLFLGHRRLAILDLSPLGHQPMASIDQNFWIVYNGEIYNYIELREELTTLGYAFKGHSDTEVLLAAYQAWGADCVKKLNGMWAFVILDRRRQVLFGSRDRFGVKPLYYFKDEHHFAFASEVKALLTLPFVKREANPNAIFDYLVMRREGQKEESFFKNIYELTPAFSFEFNLVTGQLNKWRYYSLAVNTDWEKFDATKATAHTEKTREYVLRSIRLRLRSDVPVGTCLSGGIDSASIVTSITHLLQHLPCDSVGERQKTFTTSYPGLSIDESRWAKIVVERTKADWHQTFPSSPELLNDLKDLVYTQDMPFGSTSIYAQYRVMKLAAENNIKVLLDGQGADELFAGYPHFYRAFFLDILKNHDYHRFFSETINLRNSPLAGRPVLRPFLKYYLQPKLSGIATQRFWQNINNPNRYITPEFWGKNYGQLEELTGESTSSLNGTLNFYMSNRSLKTLLRYEDRNSMRFSIEARTPFADDPDLINNTFNIPASYKIYQGWNKFLLRSAMKDILPQAIAQRRDKVSFAAPEYRWLNEIKEPLRSSLSNKLSPYINVKEILRDWDKIFRAQNQYGSTDIWRIINLSLWLDVFNI